MLDQIKSKLSTPVTKSFSEYYLEYVMRMQDEAISHEMMYLKKNNVLEVKNLEQLLALSYDKHGGVLI